MQHSEFFEHFNALPLIAILRGVTPDECIAVGDELIGQQLQILEVPLNSPDPFNSIRRLSKRYANKAIVGAGTVLTVEQVNQVHQAGGTLVLSPNMDPTVIKETLKLGMIPVPGVATATEAFTALNAGAQLLKVFPAVTVSAPFFQQISAVLPSQARLLAVGGVDLANMPDFFNAGAAGFGIGSALYKKGKPLQDVAATAHEYQISIARMLATNK
jgi:2-dehydro-3-deoxyphosphogalactonate aldolase